MVQGRGEKCGDRENGKMNKCESSIHKSLVSQIHREPFYFPPTSELGCSHIPAAIQKCGEGGPRRKPDPRADTLPRSI